MNAPEASYFNNKNNQSNNEDYSIFNLALNKKVLLYFKKPIKGTNFANPYNIEGTIEKIQGQFILFKAKKEIFIFNLNDISSLKFIDNIGY